MPSKTTINFLFNDIWCYFFIACFIQKFAFFRKQLKRFIISLNDLVLNSWLIKNMLKK